MRRKKLSLAIMGIRGIPARYGGFETFAEEMTSRFVRKGHDVTVYNRTYAFRIKTKKYRSIRLKILPAIQHKYLETVSLTFLCVLDSLFESYDVILICNAANSVFSSLPRIFGRKVVVNVDGIERLRKKWSMIGKA